MPDWRHSMLRRWTAAKGSQYYLGMGAVTGTPQSVFLTGYASLTEMGDVHDYNETTIGDKLDGLAMDHSGSLAGEDTAIWRLHPELSNPGTLNLAKMRFMELIQIHVKPGYGPEFAEVTKHIKEGWMKADPDFRYSIYRQTFGTATDDAYLIVIAMKSLAELYKHHSLAAEYQKAVGADVYKHMLEIESNRIDIRADRQGSRRRCRFQMRSARGQRAGA